MPAVVTAIAPVSYMRFEKQGDDVSFTANQCLLFCIPYKVHSIPKVKSVGNKVIAARSKTAEERRRTNSGRATIEGEASLIVTGEDDQSTAVPVSPVSIKSVTERAEAFLDSPNEKPLSMFVVANWKFSLIFGGLVSLFTVMYVVGIVVTIFMGLYRLAGFSRAGETINLSDEGS